MRKPSNRDRNQPLPPHFVVYDYDNPSPVFTPEHVADIESIRNDFDDEDLARIRKIETWILNTNTGWLNSPAIPGLRPEPTIGHRYFRRFSQDRYEKMIEELLDHVSPAYPSERSIPCNMPMFRVILPNGDKFYPIMFHDDMEKFIRLLEEAAAFFHTELGQFDRGKFVVSNGEVYPFSAIGVEALEVVPPAKGW